MMYRWWCEDGGDRAWWVIESVFLWSPDKGIWAWLGDLPPDCPHERPNVKHAIAGYFTSLHQRQHWCESYIRTAVERRNQDTPLAIFWKEISKNMSEKKDTDNCWVHFKIWYNKIKKLGMTLPSSILEFKLLKKSKITKPKSVDMCEWIKLLNCSEGRSLISNILTGRRATPI